MRQPVIFCLILLLGACNDAKPSASWELAAQGLYAGALSDSGELAVVGSLYHGASLWRVTDHERMFNWSHEAGEYAELTATDFSPDGTRAVTTDPRTLVLWNTQNGEALNYWATPSTVLDVALLNDNRHVLMGLDDHSALLFDAISGAYEFTFLHEGVVGSVAVDDAGELALTGSDDNQAILWSLNNGRQLQKFPHNNPVREVALSPRGTYAFTAAQGDLVAIWHTQSGQRLHVLYDGINHGVITGRFSADEQYLAVGYTNRQVALFHVPTGQKVDSWDPGARHDMRQRGAAIVEVAFADNIGAIYALSGDGRLIQFRRS